LYHTQDMLDSDRDGSENEPRAPIRVVYVRK
jgi:hypothetical protein